MGYQQHRNPDTVRGVPSFDFNCARNRIGSTRQFPRIGSIGDNVWQRRLKLPGRQYNYSSAGDFQASPL